MARTQNHRGYEQIFTVWQSSGQPCPVFPHHQQQTDHAQCQSCSQAWASGCLRVTALPGSEV